MAGSDDFVRATVTAMLQPGEAIVAMGWMAKLDGNWRELRGERYFGVGTTARFIVIQTIGDMLSVIPKSENRGVRWIDYPAMQSAGTHRFAPLSDSFLIKSAQGEMKFCVPSPAIIGASGMDGHKAFDELYLVWLSRHVAQGSFANPQAWQAALAEWSDPVAMNQANVRFAPKSAAAARQRLKDRVKWPAWMMLVGLVILFAGAGMMGKAHGRSAQGKAEMVIVGGIAWCAVFMVLLVVLNLRKRATRTV